MKEENTTDTTTVRAQEVAEESHLTGKGRVMPFATFERRSSEVSHLPRKGYKMTEVGRIPQDWEVKKFGDVMTGFSSGATPSRSRPDYYRGNIRWITSGELNYNIINDTIEKITEEAVRNTNLKILPEGTFLMAITGLEAEGTRGSCGIVGREAATNQSCMALFPNEELLTEYLYHYYVLHGDALALKYCQGTKQQSYTGRIARILPIVFPSKAEQAAIAAALGDADALIQSLKKLLEKKQNVKQATMQVLLTGKKRLPGFSGEWEMKKLVDIGECVSGLTYKPENIKEDGWLVLRSSNIYKNTLSFVDRVYVDIEISEKIITREGDILICVRNGSKDLIGKSALMTGKGVGVTFGAFMTVYRTQYYKFIFHLFNSHIIKYQISENLGATINQITNKNLCSFVVPFPPLEEQTAIATILSDMDAEISALERKLEKYCQLKQGMMHNLLSGKIRLPGVVELEN